MRCLIVKTSKELQAGVLLAGAGLHPIAKAKRVRFDGISRTVIDGPFVQTGEFVAGFWIWKCASMDEAVDWLKKYPSPHADACEVETR